MSDTKPPLKDQQPETAAPDTDPSGPPPEPPIVTADNGARGIRPPSDGPHAEALARATLAFQYGDFRQARQLATGVLDADPTEAERAFVAEIIKRTGMDPLALAIGLACLALFLLVLYSTYSS